MENPVRRLDSRWIHEGNLVRLRLDTVVQPQGTVCTYEYVEIKPGASVLAMHGDGDVVLVQEWKYALDGPSLEVVSGGMEPDEDPLVCAQRELREEAGLTAREWRPMGRIDPFTTMLRCPTYLFLAQGLEAVGHEREEGEVMHIHRMPLERAVSLVLHGDITHSSSALLILKVARMLSGAGGAQ